MFGKVSMRHMRLVLVVIALITAMTMATTAFAASELSGVRVTDVTTSSFSMVWVADTVGEPEIYVYADAAMKNLLNASLEVSILPEVSPEVRLAALGKGIIKVRVHMLNPSTTYYARAVMKDPTNPFNSGQSPLLDVHTAEQVLPYKSGDNGLQGTGNDLSRFEVYVHPMEINGDIGAGDLLVLQSDESLYPISAYVGDDIAAPGAVLDMNNLFDSNGRSLDLTGGERFVINVYRRGTLDRLVHYRRAADEGSMVNVSSPLNGFFADINLDGNVDIFDFDMFKPQYKTGMEDVSYNPDFDFFDDSEGIVDVREFSLFSEEFGRTGIQ
jgi:hypothetical protein